MRSGRAAAAHRLDPRWNLYPTDASLVSKVAKYVNMTDIKSLAEPVYPRDEEVRQGIELLFFAYRDFTAEPDAILTRYDFGRAHHRVIHFVGRHPQMTVSELLSILRITKQSLSRVLGQLVRQEFILQRPGPQDRRQRLLELTQKGERIRAPALGAAARAGCQRLSSGRGRGRSKGSARCSRGSSPARRIGAASTPQCRASADGEVRTILPR